MRVVPARDVRRLGVKATVSHVRDAFKMGRVHVRRSAIVIG